MNVKADYAFGNWGVGLHYSDTNPESLNFNADSVPKNNLPA